jgi:hypothetical protein
LRKKWIVVGVWWNRVFAGFFAEIWWLDVVIFWFLCGETCGEDGQETITFLALKLSHLYEFFVWSDQLAGGLRLAS